MSHFFAPTRVSNSERDVTWAQFLAIMPDLAAGKDGQQSTSAIATPIKAETAHSHVQAPTPSIGGCLEACFFAAGGDERHCNRCHSRSVSILSCDFYGFPLLVATPAPKAATNGDQGSATASPMPRPLGVSRNANSGSVATAGDALTTPSRLVS
jgi:hypothetical protein